jgi:hypothetical protein
LQIDRLRSLAALVGLGLERDAHAFVEIADAGPLDRRHVHEDVLAAIVGLDETESLLGIVKLHGAALAHRGDLLTTVGWDDMRARRRGHRLLGSLRNSGGGLGA